MNLFPTIELSLFSLQDFSIVKITACYSKQNLHFMIQLTGIFTNTAQN